MSKSPMITIKEAKEILEDFSPLNKEESDKDLKKKFKITVSNKEKKEDIEEYKARALAEIEAKINDKMAEL